MRRMMKLHFLRGIFQETLNNVIRHAKATRVKTTLVKKSKKLELKVEDDGKGIAKNKNFDSKSSGILGMRERIFPWDGQIDIHGIRGHRGGRSFRWPRMKNGLSSSIFSPSKLTASGDSRRAFICTRCPVRCITAPPAARSLWAWTGSSSLLIPRLTKWRII